MLFFRKELLGEGNKRFLHAGLHLGSDSVHMLCRYRIVSKDLFLNHVVHLGVFDVYTCTTGATVTSPWLRTPSRQLIPNWSTSTSADIKRIAISATLKASKTSIKLRRSGKSRSFCLNRSTLSVDGSSGFTGGSCPRDWYKAAIAVAASVSGQSDKTGTIFGAPWRPSNNRLTRISSCRFFCCSILAACRRSFLLRILPPPCFIDARLTLPLDFSFKAPLVACRDLKGLLDWCSFPGLCLCSISRTLRKKTSWGKNGTSQLLVAEFFPHDCWILFTEQTVWKPPSHPQLAILLYYIPKLVLVCMHMLNGNHRRLLRYLEYLQHKDHIEDYSNSCNMRALHSA